MTQSLPCPPAGLVRRMAAMAYDWLLLAGLMSVFTLGAILLRGGDAIPPSSWWFDAALIGIGFGFFGWFWTHGGQTLGMRAWKVRLVRNDGREMTWSDALRRFIASFVLLLPPGLGFFWGWLDHDRRCWHDRLSATHVISLQTSLPTEFGSEPH